jgi:hypothetical protein
MLLARNRPLWALVIIVLLVTGGTVAFRRRAPAKPARDLTAAREAMNRQNLFAELRPVKLTNCTFERFGERNEGGYLLCANLLGSVGAGYSYGIAGTDGWGCDVSRKLNVAVHQYDCVDLRQPSCAAGRTVFHAECAAGGPVTKDGRLFDTVESQVAKNGDDARHLVMKLDVEGTEWEALWKMPDAVLQRIEQLDVEFHHNEEERLVALVQRLKLFFYVAHVHFNNYTCDNRMMPFPSSAYEVLFVNKTLAAVDPSGAAGGLLPLDAPNNPGGPDCQVTFP